MSEFLLEAEAALAWEADPALDVIVYGVLMGQQLDVPDPIDTVEIVWGFTDRPGVFVHRVGVVGNWQEAAHFGIMIQKYKLEQIYAILGGWPEPVLPDGGGVLPPGVE